MNGQEGGAVLDARPVRPQRHGSQRQLGSMDDGGNQDLAALRRALDAVVQMHHGLALRMAMDVLGSGDEAEDAVHAAVLQAVRGLPGFDARASLKTWYLRIVRNTALNQLRDRSRRQRREATLETAAPALAQSEPAGCPQSEADSALRALDELVEADRHSLRMRYLDEASYEHIAGALGVTCASARSRVARALQRLRRRIALVLLLLVPGRLRLSAAMDARAGLLVCSAAVVVGVCVLTLSAPRSPAVAPGSASARGAPAAAESPWEDRASRPEGTHPLLLAHSGIWDGRDGQPRAVPVTDTLPTGDYRLQYRIRFPSQMALDAELCWLLLVPVPMDGVLLGHDAEDGAAFARHLHSDVWLAVDCHVQVRAADDGRMDLTCAAYLQGDLIDAFRVRAAPADAALALRQGPVLAEIRALELAVLPGF